ncbi:MAG: hypothetical protein Q8M40_05945, partial [Legionella sp.]|nr:hypothetical protein [Legionella sp.]
TYRDLFAVSRNPAKMHQSITPPIPPTPNIRHQTRTPYVPRFIRGIQNSCFKFHKLTANISV